MWWKCLRADAPTSDYSGDTTPFRVTGVTLHSHVRDKDIPHGVVFPELLGCESPVPMSHSGTPRWSGDTTPCRMTGVTLHYTGLYPQSWRQLRNHNSGSFSRATVGWRLLTRDYFAET